jgi:hypothetical protein
MGVDHDHFLLFNISLMHVIWQRSIN